MKDAALTHSSDQPSRKKRRHRKPSEKSILERIKPYFSDKGLTPKRKERYQKKRKKLIKGIFEYIMWALVIGTLIISIIYLFSDISIKDRRNKRKKAYEAPVTKQPEDLIRIKFAYT